MDKYMRASIRTGLSISKVRNAYKIYKQYHIKDAKSLTNLNYHTLVAICYEIDCA